MKQRSFASVGLSGLDFASHGRLTRKAKFLIEMNEIVPWRELCRLIEPHYPKAGNGRRPIGLERMPRIHFLQRWFNLADEACEEALYDTVVFREFAMIDLGEERFADATTLLKFRRLLETHALGEAIFARVNALLAERGLRVSGGTMVDATIISAPLSEAQKAKNRAKSAVRAAVEHPFLFIKRIWGYAKTRYRGIAKNHNRLLAMCALYNLKKANVRLAA
jgi:IS5 family transposase